MIYKKIVGLYGEKLAGDYLIKKGYKIINKNIKISYQEIDIIASKNNKIIFVEVKTRTNDLYGSAEEAINKNKLKNIKKAIMNYSNINLIDVDNINFDIITVNIDKIKKVAKIKHYLNIF